MFVASRPLCLPSGEFLLHFSGSQQGPGIHIKPLERAAISSFCNIVLKDPVSSAEASCPAEFCSVKLFFLQAV